MSAVFRAKCTTVIKGRGVVLFGTIEEGTIKAGMSFTIPGIESRLEIQDVSFVHQDGPDRNIVGLCSDSIPEREYESWLELDVDA